MNDYIPLKTFFWIAGAFVMVQGFLYTQILQTDKELEVYKEQSFREVADIKFTVGVIDVNVQNVKEDVGDIKRVIDSLNFEVE